MKNIQLIYLLLIVPINLLFAQPFESQYRQIDATNGLSQVSVRALHQDKNGFIWIGTDDGLNRYDGNEFVVFRNNPTDSTSLSDSTIITIIEDQNGNIWTGTGAGGVCKYNPRINKFKRYLNLPDKNSRISDNVTFVMHIDANNKIWVGHRKGLDVYNEELDRFEPVEISKTPGPGNTVYGMTSNENQLWLATGSGLKQLNTSTKEVEKVYTNNPKDQNSISFNFIRNVTLDGKGVVWIVMANYEINSINPQTGEIKRYFQKSAPTNPQTRLIYHDKNGNLWLSTTLFGAVLFDPKTETIKSPDLKPVSSETPFNYQASVIIEDQQGSLWVGSLGRGVIHYNINANSFGYKKNLSTIPFDSRTDGFGSIFEDTYGNLWLASYNKGLLKVNMETDEVNEFKELNEYLKIDKLKVLDIIQDSNGFIWIATQDQGFIRVSPKTNEFKVYYNTLDEKNPVGSNFFYLIRETSDGKIWFASVGILTAFDPLTEEIKTYKFNPNAPEALPGTIISELYEDMDNKLWISFFSVGLFSMDRNTDTFTKANYEVSNNYITGPVQITSMYQNKKDILWIGTAQGLLKYKTKEGTADLFTTKNGLSNNRIYSIIEDKANNLWISTSNGISKFNIEKEAFKNYNAEDGLQQSQFEYQSAQVGLKTGLMYFGGSKGFNFFDPADITENLNAPPIIFTEFKKYTKEGIGEELLGINYKNNIRLPYKERDFSVKVAALDYTNPSKNQYAYWLEGYNDNWIETGTKRDINFTNLSPGSYTLKVKGANNDGIWNEQEKTLQISILPPWWGTWWAYTIYALALIAMLYAGYTYRINQLETVRLKELDETKRTMYTNITHEFRTPLTVISGINKEIQEKSEGKFKNQFELIERNSKNMLYLVNQLLELRKLEIGKTEMNYVQGDLIAYLKYLAESFQSYAKSKNITLHFVTITPSMLMDYDPDKLLMIMSNLLSNAIKYSPPNTAVYLQIDELEDKVNIRVVDSGRGIPEEKLPHIFDRFYKVQNKTEDNIDGVGIGLAVTKELVELMDGEIVASSKLNKGSIFSITLPIQNKAPRIQTTLPEEESAQLKPIETEINLEENLIQPNEEAQNLLIIEDNKDIVQYLKSVLEPNWNLKFATDGQIGIDKAINDVPDIILCDLMMPNANGYKVLESLKNNENTSHIPIVILTAKADEESRLEAYKKGADAYLLKPFNKDELQIILQKLIEQRRILQERYQAQSALKFVDGVEIRKEDTFIQKLEELVLSENSEKSHSITDLCRDLGMSRTQLHNKIKALTGKSTSIFVRTLRLRKGKYLLEHTNKGISEIAYNVGFNNPSYFTKSFTEEFGIPPSSLRK